MPTKFLESLGSKLGEQWVANVLTPAFAFWFGGALAAGWAELFDHWKPLDEPSKIGVLISALLLIVASGFVVQKFDLIVLRSFEGYWPGWLRPLSDRLITQTQREYDRLDQKWINLEQKRSKTGLTVREQEELIELDGTLRQFPGKRDRIMPTRLGNILRAAESQPGLKYGLDAIICWPRLWLVLPDSARKELQEARADLNTAARVLLWGILFLIWTLWAWWALPIGLLVAWFAYGWMLESARTYGDLLESAFDLYRLELYKALHWPLPENPSVEPQRGQQLTEYLWRGSDRPHPTFTHPSK